MSIPETIKWLQFSDIHIRKSTDYNVMMMLLEELAEQFHPDFIVVTGDFRHLEYCKDFNAGLEYLNKVSEIFEVPKKDFYLVPGNHDTIKVTNPGDAYLYGRDTAKILTNSITSSDLSPEEVNYLEKAFDEYRNFVKSFYDGSLPETDERISNPSGVMCIPRDNLNLILVNTALVSDGKREHKELLDMKTLSSLKLPNDNPSIILAHHALDCLSEKQSARMPILMQKHLHACAYLCGDAHREAGRWVSEKIVDQQIPCFICGKSVDDEQDDWSDVCVMGYTWNLLESSVAVQVFEYENGIKDERYEAGFHDKKVYYRGGKPFSFAMRAADVGSQPVVTLPVDLCGDIRSTDETQNEREIEIYITTQEIKEFEEYQTKALMYEEAADYNKALVYFDKMRVIVEGRFGKRHTVTAEMYHNLGVICGKKEDYPAAIEYLEKAFFIRKTKLGESHSDTKKSLGLLYEAYIQSGKAPYDFSSWLASQWATQT